MLTPNHPALQEQAAADDRAEFARRPEMRFLVRERYPHELSARDPRRPGARPLVTVFRDGSHDSFFDAPGWLALGRYVVAAEWAIAKRPELTGAAAASVPPYQIDCVSPLVSGFVYLDAPGTIGFGVDCVRIYRGWDADLAGHGWRVWTGLYQHRLDGERKFKTARLNAYDGPLIFPRQLMRAGLPARLALRYAPVPKIVIGGLEPETDFRGWKVTPRGWLAPKYSSRAEARFRPQLS